MILIYLPLPPKQKKRIMLIKGYKTVGYEEMVTLLGVANAEYLDGGGSEMKLADNIGLKTIQTIRNCFNAENQKVADETLTHLMKIIDFDGFVLWKDGQRLYYVKGK